MKVKVKDFNPKYETVLVLYDERYLIVELHTLKRICGECYVYSYTVHEDTKTISVIIGKEPLDCEEETTPHRKF